MIHLGICLVCVLLITCLAGAEPGIYKPLREGTADPLRLQDFCAFRHGEYTYVAPMMKDFCNEGIMVARSKDLANWEDLGKAVSKRTAEDASMVWAPHVVEDKGVFYMFYTGVTQPQPGRWCQRILIAGTKNPSSPDKWERDSGARFIVDGKEQSWFRPSHPGAVWTDMDWADCRDPMVLKHKGTWYLFYSGTDTDGGITGVCTAPGPLGPWTDRGAVMKVGQGIPESCFVLEAPDGSFVMTFNHAGGDPKGSKTARGKSLLPVDGKPSFSDIRVMSDTTGAQLEGWAHEFIPGKGKTFTAAYLTGYWVNFRECRFHKESWGWTLNAAGK